MNLIADRVRRIAAAREASVGTMRVVPLTGPSHLEPRYRVYDASLTDYVRITEVSDSGQVPVLKVTNDLDEPVLILDGQGLRGAKQNRMLNTDVLVAPKTTIPVPVSCVEAGRWSRKSHMFTPEAMASASMRLRKARRVHESLQKRGTFDADQREVWNDVADVLRSAGSVNPTSALHEAYARHRGRLDEVRRDLKLPEDTVGIAIYAPTGRVSAAGLDTLASGTSPSEASGASGDSGREREERFICADLFDRASTLERFWRDLVDSCSVELLVGAAEELEGGPAGAHPESASSADAAGERRAVLADLLAVADASWESYDTPGLGQSWRAETPTHCGSALVLQDEAIGDVVLHLQVFGNGRDDDDRRRRVPFAAHLREAGSIDWRFDPPRRHQVR